MRIILSADSSYEDSNGDCDYAVVDLTEDLAEFALRRIEMLRRLRMEDKDLWKMYFWDWHCEWFRTSDAMTESIDPESGKALSDLIWDEEYVIVGDHASAAIAEKVGRTVSFAFEPPEGDGQRTECDQMIVHDDDVAWVAIPKNMDLYVTTRSLPVSLLERVAGRKIAVPIQRAA